MQRKRTTLKIDDVLNTTDVAQRCTIWAPEIIEDEELADTVDRDIEETVTDVICEEMGLTNVFKVSSQNFRKLKNEKYRPHANRLRRLGEREKTKKSSGNFVSGWRWRLPLP